MNEGFVVSVRMPDGSVSRIEVTGTDTLTVGRDEGCNVVLPSPSVSRVHLRAVKSGACVSVVDCSSNGTILGDGAIRGTEADLPPDGDLRVGPYVLRIAAMPLDSGNPPDTAELRRRIHRALLDHLNLSRLDAAGMGDAVLRPRVVEALRLIVASLDADTRADLDETQLVAEMTDEVLGLGPLQQLLHDDAVSEIMVVDPSRIYVERGGRISLTSLRFTDDESCRAAIERIVTPLGRRIDESTPLVDARLKDGSRVNAIIPPLAIRGPCITIRKFARSVLRMENLVAQGSLSAAMARFLQRCVRARKNIIISGGAGSGKTTLLNTLSTEIDSEERIVTIEDAAELCLDQPHVVSLESKPCNLEGTGGYGIRDLLRNALRMRPDRIIVGECRAGEAIDMLQAMNTGHDGSMTTMHANSAEEAAKRVETLCMMAGLELSAKSIREQVAASVEVIVQQTRYADGSRRLTSITEVSGLDEDGELVLHDIFSFQRTGTSSEGGVLGHHRSTGYVPSFLDEFIAKGLVDGGEFL